MASPARFKGLGYSQAAKGEDKVNNIEVRKIHTKLYEYIEEFSQKHNLIDVLEKLFDWGIIGNSGQRMVFKFLGDRDLSPTEDMIIHTPLRNFFAVKSRRRKTS